MIDVADYDIYEKSLEGYESKTKLRKSMFCCPPAFMSRQPDMQLFLASPSQIWTSRGNGESALKSSFSSALATVHLHLIARTLRQRITYFKYYRKYTWKLENTCMYAVISTGRVGMWLLLIRSRNEGYARFAVSFRDAQVLRTSFFY